MYTSLLVATAFLGQALARLSVAKQTLEPWQTTSKLLMSCETVAAEKANDTASQKLHDAMHDLCKDEANRPFMEMRVEYRFQRNYAKIYDNSGWVDEAWVNYVKVQPGNKYFAQLTERMIESVHLYSKKPIIVVNFGDVDIPELTPTRFPNLVMLRARNVEQRGVSFHFNKFQAVLLSRVKVGVSLDSDMTMVTPLADNLFQRTKEEINAAYPFPMMPVHFLDRDPADAWAKKGNFLSYDCDGCPKPTMRWGQAQPSWTFYSLPFLARWQTAKLGGLVQRGVQTKSVSQDEDMLNVALWSEGATKQWCVFQSGGTDFVWQNYLPQHPPGPNPYYEDPKYYPKGLPLVYYFAHAEKDVQDIDKALNLLKAEEKKPEAAHLNSFFYNMTFYSNFADMKAAHPEITCKL